MQQAALKHLMRPAYFDVSADNTEKNCCFGFWIDCMYCDAQQLACKQALYISAVTLRIIPTAKGKTTMTVDHIKVISAGLALVVKVLGSQQQFVHVLCF